MKNNAGAISTAWNYLEVFQQNGIVTDYVHSADTWGAPLDEEDAGFLKKKGLVRHIFSLYRKPDSISKLKHWLHYRLLRLCRDLRPQRAIPNFVTNYNQYLFNKILKEHSYDYIVISYVYWANFVWNNPYTGKAKLIIDTHDFLTAQEWAGGKINIGHAFSEEIRRLNFFDQIWTVSIEEKYLFQQFVTKKVVLVPFCTDDHTAPGTREKKYDIIYVAGDNLHNIKAAEWFFKNVYPLLDSSIKFCIVGAINKNIFEKINIHKVSYAPDLNDYYPHARIAICPMLTGTGVKVKVVEALSYGLPVVCNPRGVDGLVNKTENGCVVTESAIDFAAAIRELLANPGYYKEISMQAASFFIKNHSAQRLQNVVCNALID